MQEIELKEMAFDIDITLEPLKARCRIRVEPEKDTIQDIKAKIKKRMEIVLKDSEAPHAYFYIVSDKYLASLTNEDFELSKMDGKKKILMSSDKKTSDFFDVSDEVHQTKYIYHMRPPQYDELSEDFQEYFSKYTRHNRTPSSIKVFFGAKETEPADYWKTLEITKQQNWNEKQKTLHSWRKDFDHYSLNKRNKT